MKLSGGGDRVKEEAETAIAQYAELNRSSIVQNAARAAATEQRALEAVFRKPRGGDPPHATQRKPPPVLGAIARVGAAAQAAAISHQATAGAIDPLAALKALRASLEQVAALRRSNPPPPKGPGLESLMAALPIICPHTALPVLLARPRSTAASNPTLLSLHERNALLRTSGINSREFWQRELQLDLEEYSIVR